MEETKIIIIKSIEFDMTSNGNVLTKIYGDDNNVITFYSGAHYLFSRKESDEIQYTTNDKGFNNVVIPKAYGDIYSAETPMGKMLRRTYENFRLGLCQVKNGALNKLTEYETENWISDHFDEVEFFLDKTYEKVLKSETPFMKHLAQQFPLKKASRCCDPEHTVLEMAYKDYAIYRQHNELVRDN